jgi:hypothetical protein
VVVKGRRREPGAPSLPLVVDGLDVGDPQVEEGVEAIRVVMDVEDDLWFVSGRTASRVDADPDVGEFTYVGAPGRTPRQTTSPPSTSL